MQFEQTQSLGQPSRLKAKHTLMWFPLFHPACISFHTWNLTFSGEITAMKYGVSQSGGHKALDSAAIGCFQTLAYCK